MSSASSSIVGAGEVGGNTARSNMEIIKISAGVGGVVTGILLTVTIFLICIVLYRRRSSKHRMTQKEDASNSGMHMA